MFSGRIKDAVVVITSDHGHIDTKKSKIIDIKNHPRILETLRKHLCGEPRAAYFYVKKDKAKVFEEYIKRNLSRACIMHKSRYLIRKRFFGPHKRAGKLSERIGDYVLIAKENYIIVDSRYQKIFTGNHGGISDEEMSVPLIVIKR